MRLLLLAPCISLVSLAMAGCSSAEGAPVEHAAPDLEAGSDAGVVAPVLLPVTQQLTAAELGVLINTDDPQSVAIGAAYVDARKVPEENVVRLALGAPTRKVSAATFQGWKSQVDAALPSAVQALALTFTEPSIVEDCESITAAFTFGYDPKYCVACNRGPRSPLYSKSTSRPFTDLGVRPSMMLAASSVEEGKKLIARGVAADGTFPSGKGYFFRTTDSARSDPRYKQFQSVITSFDASSLEVQYIDETAGGAPNLQNAPDVLLYMTGRERVPDIGTNTYRPGAFADHLTSFAGVFSSKCEETGQMNVLCWLEAGVTASYGTVIEPCSWPQKFPEPKILTEAYFRGATVLEAAWQSVAAPGQGVFVGEPLARPFGGRSIAKDASHVTIETTELVPGKPYALEGATEEEGPWTTLLEGIEVTKPTRYTTDVELGWRFLRLRRM